MSKKPTYQELEKRVQELEKEVPLRQQAEKALKESEKRFRTLLQNSSDIQVVLDENGVERFVSESVEMMTGYTPDDFLGKNGFEFIHPDDLEVVSKAFMTLKERKSGFVRAEYRHSGKDGSWVHLEAIGTNLLDDPVIQGIVLNVRNITEKKQAEKALKESEEKYRSIIKNIQEGYYEVDIAGNLKFFNESLLKIFGYPKHEMLGMNNWAFKDNKNGHTS